MLLISASVSINRWHWHWHSHQGILVSILSCVRFKTIAFRLICHNVSHSKRNQYLVGNSNFAMWIIYQWQSSYKQCTSNIIPREKSLNSFDFSAERVLQTQSRRLVASIFDKRIRSWTSTHTHTHKKESSKTRNQKKSNLENGNGNGTHFRKRIFIHTSSDLIKESTKMTILCKRSTIIPFCQIFY